MPSPEPKKTVGIGPTTWVGWAAAVLGLAPSLIKSVEAGTIAFHASEKWAAIAGVVSLAITQIGRYVQAAKL